MVYVQTCPFVIVPGGSGKDGGCLGLLLTKGRIVVSSDPLSKVPVD